MGGEIKIMNVEDFFRTLDEEGKERDGCHYIFKGEENRCSDSQAW